MNKPVILCILDGWGLSKQNEGNAPLIANTPTLDKLISSCPNSKLITHGPDVGLPEGQMGNSEVGHMNIGAGRVVSMDLVQINLAIQNKTFFKKKNLKGFIKNIRKSSGAIHLVGLLSDGGVHGHINHILASMEYFSKKKFHIILHLITDGRDVAPKSALEYLKKFSNLPENVTIGTVCGRYYAMDRDNRWERTKLAYNAIILGLGLKENSIKDCLKGSYERGETDEFIKPTVLNNYKGVSEKDGLLILNFRSDRVLQLMDAIANPSFNKISLGARQNIHNVLGMVNYSERHQTFMSSIFIKNTEKNNLGSWISQHNLKQLRVAETEKYPHVTFFFNGGKENAEILEDRYMPESPKVETYDMAPEMAATEITKKVLEGLNLKYSFILANYANPDMVGHTGNLNATIKACEAIDLELKKIIKKLKVSNGIMLIIADHGNCEKMIDSETRQPHTAHTLNLVPAILVGYESEVTLRDGRLSDIAPTILDLMNLPKPSEMTGKTLIMQGH